MHGMQPLVSFSPEDITRIRGLVAGHPLYRLYLEDGLEASRRGEANRLACISRTHKGLALGIRFDRLEVRTLIGALTADEELALADFDGDGEFHLGPGPADRVAAAFSERLEAYQRLRYYCLDRRPDIQRDARCRRLGPAEYELVAGSFLAFYPGGVFSKWMLDGLFLGIFEGGRLIACGGVIAQTASVANIGNFLTIPDARGRGLARSIAVTLAHLLADRGTNVATLTTTEENIAACRAYEAAGFRCFDRRIQINLSARPRPPDGTSV